MITMTTTMKHENICVRECVLSITMIFLTLPALSVLLSFLLALSSHRTTLARDSVVD